MWRMGSVALWYVGSFWARARTRVPCIGRRILNHCATREVPFLLPVLISYVLGASLKRVMVLGCLLRSNWKHHLDNSLTDGPHCKDLGTTPLNPEPALGSVRRTGFLVPVLVTLCRYQGCASSVLPCQLPLLYLVFSPFKH